MSRHLRNRMYLQEGRANEDRQSLPQDRQPSHRRRQLVMSGSRGDDFLVIQ
jgi:hypothetical protein